MFAIGNNQAVLDTIVIPAGEGWAGTVGAGKRVLFGLHAGSQVLDLNLFSSENPAEHFGSSVTRMRHGSHVVAGDTLLSCPPSERPLGRVAALSPDAIDPVGRGASAAASHDLLFGRCSAALRARVYGAESPGCQEILTEALARAGFPALLPHDPLNIFMRTGIDENGQLFFTDPATTVGDTFEIDIWTDCIVAVSACPGSSSGPNPSGATVMILDGSAPLPTL